MRRDTLFAQVGWRFVGVAVLGWAIVAGEARALWWLWIVYWLGAEVTEWMVETSLARAQEMRAENERLRDALRGVVDPPFHMFAEWRATGSSRSADAMEAWTAKVQEARALLGGSPEGDDR